MIIAVPTTSKDINSPISPVFGRCPFFIIADIQDNKINNSKAVPNSAMDQRGGAGIAASQLVGNKGAEAIITLGIGPRAFSVLQQLDIDMYQGKRGKVKDNIDAFMNKELQPIAQPGRIGRGIGKGGRGRAGPPGNQAQGRGRGGSGGRGQGNSKGKGKR